MIEEKDKGGRPSNYSVEMTAKIWQLADMGGANVAQMCRAVGIGSFSTFYSYREKYPEFKQATEYCSMSSCATLESALMEGATGEKKIDSKAAMWMLYNRDQEQYKMPGRPAAGDQNINIKIGNLNIANITKLSGKELDRLIEQTEASIKIIEDTQLPEIKDQSTKVLDHVE